MDHLGLVQPVDRLGQRVVVTVADAAHRWLDPGFGQPLGVADADVLHAAVGVVDQAALGRPRTYSAWSSASRTKSVRAERETFQPTIRRA